MSGVFEFNDSGERLFCVSDGREFSYGELERAVERVEGELVREGVREGEVVAFGGRYGFWAVVLSIALYRRKNVQVPLAGSGEMDLEARVFEAGAGWFLKWMGDEKLLVERREVVETHPLVAEVQRRGRPGLILFSSGSTGRPKGMLHDMERLVGGYRRGGVKDFRVLAFMGIDHIGGLDMLFRAIASRSVLVIPPERSPEAICRLIEEHRVDVLPATPTFLNLLLLSEAYRGFDLSSLRIIGFGAERMPQAVMARLREVFPYVEFQQKFGTSETNAVRTLSRPDDPLWMRIEDDRVEWRVVEGELWLKTPSRILGYLNHSDERLEGEGWYRTGDLVEEREGYFRVIGRLEGMINVGGEKVLPGEVEEVIRELREVEDCRVFGVANPILGEVVEAEVQVAAGVDRGQVAGLVRRHCRDRLARFKVPVRIRLVDGFEMSERGKKIGRN